MTATVASSNVYHLFQDPKAQAKEALKDAPQQEEQYEYEHLTPYHPDVKWPALEPFEVTDKAENASRSFENLFKAVDKVSHLTLKIGTILEGIDLSKLDDAQKDELALLTAYRGVVFIKDQKHFDVHQQVALGKYWGNGKLHEHATTALPKAAEFDKSLEAVHVVYYDGKIRQGRVSPTDAFTPTRLWHSDVSYELQPPSYTTLQLLTGPDAGGDTLWSSGYALYDSLSPPLRAYLETLSATHSAQEQADDARRGNTPVRREPVVSIHPIVRTHPVTKLKSVYINPGFTRSIVGVPKGESDAILNYLYSIIATHPEHTVRYKWSAGDIALWDNRVTTHAATYGFGPHRRHAIRVTVPGEAPTYDPSGKSQQEELSEALGLGELNIDATTHASYND